MILHGYIDTKMLQAMPPPLLYAALTSDLIGFLGQQESKLENVHCCLCNHTQNLAIVVVYPQKTPAPLQLYFIVFLCPHHYNTEFKRTLEDQAGGLTYARISSPLLREKLDKYCQDNLVKVSNHEYST